jgi:RHS repeat-associated protein/uncharacterized repeat protein (TIGR01451 family)
MPPLTTRRGLLNLARVIVAVLPALFVSAASPAAPSHRPTPQIRHWDFDRAASHEHADPGPAQGTQGTFRWTPTAGAGDAAGDASGAAPALPAPTTPAALLNDVFSDSFDAYPPGSGLAGQGGWVGRFGGGITASKDRAASPPQSCRMDNDGFCWESQLYHPLPYLDVLWFSAEIMGVPTGRTGCHEYDAGVSLYNPDQGGIWGSSEIGFALRSGPGETQAGPGLTVGTSWKQVSGVYGLQEEVKLEPDYGSLVNRWIHLQAKLDHLRHRADVWVDGEYRGSLAMDPTAPPYKGIALDCGEGLGFVDNVRVFENGPEPGDDAVELTFDTPLPQTIPPDRYRFFRVTNPPNRDLLLTLDQTGTPGNLELYGGAGSPPSRGRYDAYDNSQTRAAHQSLAFPAIPGAQTYYFLVYHPAGNATASYTLLASHPGFRLDRVTPSGAANAGSVTLTLVGTGFSAGTRGSLVPRSGAPIAASSTQLVSSVRIDATFNLAAAATGPYDVRIDDPSAGTASLAAAFQVSAGNPGALAASLNAPPNMRPDRNYTVSLAYANRGGADLATPLFVISSPQDVPMRLASTEPFRHGPIQVLGVNMNRPVGVLPPGASFSIPIEFRSTPSSGSQIQLDLKVMQPDATPIDWTALATEIRPPGIADDAWTVIWSNLKARTGTTWADYLTALTASSAYLADHYREAPGALEPSEVPPSGRMPVAVYSVRELFGFALGKAAAALTPRPLLAAAVDAFYPSPGLPLAFVRVAPSPIEQRLRLGALGRSWAHIYDHTIRVDPDGAVAIRQPWGQERRFLAGANGAFSPAAADEHASLTQTAQGYLLRERDGSVLTFSAGRLDHVDDTNGNRLTMGYTGGALTSVAHSDGDRLAIDYDANGRIARVVDPAGRATLYHYDAAGEHLDAVDEPGGRTTTYAHHPADGSPAAHALSSLAEPAGTHRYFAYDEFGRLSAEWRDGDAERLNYAYDTQGTVDIHDGAGGGLTLRLGHRGQLLGFETPVGGRLTFAYDEAGNPTRIDDAASAEAMLAYDGHGNPVGLRDTAGGVTRVTHADPFDRLTALLDARGNRTGFEYDARGNLASIDYPDASREAFAVDAAGSLVASTNRRGQTITYDRDLRGRLVRKRYPDGSTRQYTYDARGNLHTVIDATGTIDLEHDDRDFLTRITYPDGHFLGFEHDASGRRTRRTDETGFSLAYEHDAAGRLARLRDAAGRQLIAYTYDAAGRLAREDRGNGTSTTYGYDGAGELLHLVHYAPDGRVQSRFDYTYDVRGNRTSMTTLAGKTTYDYDALGQLVGVTTPDGATATYQYDAAGNRVTVSKPGLAETYRTNDLNQYTQAGAAALTYDKDGNLTTRIDPTGTTTYVYDVENRLVQVRTPAAGTWAYTYDALGDRVQVTHDSQVTRYRHDPIGLVDVMAEYDGNGKLVARYVDGLGLVARIDAAGKAAYYGFDALGSTRLLTDDSGTVANIYDYDPWGGPSAAHQASPNSFQYVGRFGVVHDETGLMFMRARYYDPLLGRFATADPIGFKGGELNLYVYARNSPTDANDPSGLVFEDFEEGLQSLAGKAARQPGAVCDTSNAAGGAKMQCTEQQAAQGWASQKPYWEKAKELLISAPIIIGAAVKYDAYLITETVISARHFAEALLESVKALIIKPADPNEKLGPGPQVHPGQRVTYTIYFENQKSATAPAQEVFVTDNLDASLDWSSFELGEVAFGSMVVSSLAGHQQASSRVTYGGSWVQIEAGQTLSGRQVSWVLRTLDPNTGELPQDPLAGFLPPEDGSGRGQGHVTFSVRVRSDARLGAVVSNSAAIVFDTNPAVSTRTVTSTVTATPSSTPLSFYTVPPCRVFDTRQGTPLSAGVIRPFQVTGRCNIPASAKAVSANLTIVQPQGSGFLTVYPGDAQLPPTSNLSFTTGQVRANNSVLLLAGDASGTINTFLAVDRGTTNLLLDVNGYFQ